MTDNTATDTDRDPEPWVHTTTGTRVAHPHHEDAPQGGYTYLPRKGYADYPDRYVSTRWPGLLQEHCEPTARDDRH